MTATVTVPTIYVVAFILIVVFMVLTLAYSWLWDRYVEPLVMVWVIERRLRRGGMSPEDAHREALDQYVGLHWGTLDTD